ncbi:MAG TPA: CDP-alcohol phosphatidyltransferase family protein [Candidatus Nanoarchaeia archaeon]|nr:CDP-alcohol phosphatidyltransferase family protein [Candidatus Nanoarchaeia archaeon]
MLDSFTNFVQNAMDCWRRYRSKKLSWIAEPLVQAGIPASVVTLASFLLGLAAVFFLFQNHFLFVLFAVLHLLADALDGMVARVAKPSRFGKYMDYASDQLITLLLLVRIAGELQDYFVVIVILLFLAAQLVYLFSKLTAPVLFARTMVLFFLAIQQPIPAYLSAGVVALYSLAVQLRWCLERKTRS